MVKAYCMKCKENKELKNQKFEVTEKGFNLYRGICPDCSSNLARISGRIKLNKTKDIDTEKELEELKRRYNEVEKKLEESKKSLTQEKSYLIDGTKNNTENTEDKMKNNERKVFTPQESESYEKEKAWKEKANEVLSERDSEYRVVDSFWHNFLYSFFIIVIILGISGFLYLSYSDHYKSFFSINTTINPMFNSSINISNSYSFNPSTEVNNEYKNNYTIIINNVIHTNST